MAILACLTQLQDHTIVRYAQLEIINLPPRFHGNDPALALEKLVQDLELEPDAEGDIFDVYFRSSQRRASDRILFRHIYCVKEHFDAKDRGAM